MCVCLGRNLHASQPPLKNCPDRHRVSGAFRAFRASRPPSSPLLQGLAHGTQASPCPPIIAPTAPSTSPRTPAHHRLLSAYALPPCYRSFARSPLPPLSPMSAQLQFKLPDPSFYNSIHSHTILRNIHYSLYMQRVLTVHFLVGLFPPLQRPSRSAPTPRNTGLLPPPA